MAIESDSASAAPRSGRTRWAVALVVLAAAFVFIGARGLWEPDEGRYVAVALEMLRSGDWVHPHLAPDLPHYTKPPLTYWCIASAVAIFGHSGWAVRLPGALAFAATALAVWPLARRLAPGRGPTACAMYATSVLPFFSSNIVTPDTLLTLWETLAMLGFVLASPAWRADPSPSPLSARRRFGFGGLLLMWSAFGLAFMTKGPPALLPLAAAGVATAISLGPRATLRLFHPWGLLAFLAVAGPWFAVVITDDPSLLRYFLVDEVVARVATPAHHRNPEWYMAFMYLPILVIGLIPWSFEWLSFVRRLARPGEKRRLLRDPALVLGVSWVLIPLVIFMLARSRSSLYVLPLIAPLVIMTARLQPADWLNHRHAWRSLTITLAVLLAVRLGLGLAPVGRDARAFAAQLSVPPSVSEIVFVSQTPWRGLSLYAQRPVEEVALKPDQAEESLDEELDEEKGELLLILRAPAPRSVTRTLASKGWRLASTRHVVPPRMSRELAVMHVLPPPRPESGG